jgi:hypothetical protein
MILPPKAGQVIELDTPEAGKAGAPPPTVTFNVRPSK